MVLAGSPTFQRRCQGIQVLIEECSPAVTGFGFGSRSRLIMRGQLNGNWKQWKAGNIVFRFELLNPEFCARVASTTRRGLANKDIPGMTARPALTPKNPSHEWVDELDAIYCGIYFSNIDRSGDLSRDNCCTQVALSVT